MKNFFTVASLSVLGFATMNVANADPEVPQTLTVQFGDLDLNKPQGVDTLFKRIKSAARDVCSDFEGRTLSKKRLHSEWVEAALSTAVMRVDRPMLSQYLAEHSANPHKGSVSLASSH